MYNKQILVDSLREISTLESNRFKSLAYLNACRILDSMTQEEFDEKKSFLNIPGIGMSINTKILDFKKDGTIPAKLAKLREENKSYLDPKLYKIRKGFVTKRIRYNEAEKIVNTIKDIVVKSLSSYDINSLHFLGSFRRKKSLIADIDILTVGEEFYCDLVRILKSSNNLSVIVEGPMKTTFVFNNSEKTTIDVSWCDKYCLPYSILHFTGSAASNIRLRAKAQSLGFKLNQYTIELIDKSDVRADEFEEYIQSQINSEEDIFKILDEPYVEPENR